MRKGRNNIFMATIFTDPVVSKYLSQKEITLYEISLKKWLEQSNAQKHFGLFDHIAIKVPNEEELMSVVQAMKPFCVKVSENTPGLSVRNMHGRKIAVALLKDPIKVAGEDIFCIEIMQHRPDAVDYDIVGFDHLEIINSDQKTIEKTLYETNTDYYIDSTNPYKDIIVSYINERKERIKFTNKTLVEIVPIQIQDEPARVEIIKGGMF
jgi:predicted metalloenzyme YecM